MAKKELSIKQKKLTTDLWIIILISFAVLAIFIIFQSQIYSIVEDNSIDILLRLLIVAGFQFGLAGLGITIVAIFRKESFFSYGLKTKNIIPSVLLCVLCFVPQTIFLLVTKQGITYFPFQSVGTTNEVITNGFPANIIGILITASAWGFFEGFNYVVISDKINKRYPSKNRWLNWGAIICAVLCILIHGAIGVTLDSIIEMFTIIIIIYGMLMVKEFTGNAWGCVFIFIFLWNALSYRV